MNVEFQALTAVIMKRSVFWDVMLYSPLKVDPCFEGARFLLQG
jgi:hypothetical protein